MIIYTLNVIFLKCLIMMFFFSLLECKNRKSRSHGKRKMATLSETCVQKNANYFSKGSFSSFK